MKSVLLSSLACPRDRTSLHRESARALVCDRGHEYPIVGGVPVLLLEEREQTIALAQESLAAARKWSAAGIDAPESELFLESLGVSEGERAAAAKLALSENRQVDPVVSVLIGATNGHAYQHLIGNLREYPIPEIPLVHGKGRSLLDVGCSWGRWSIAAARKDYRVVGIDPSLGAVMAARRVAGKLGLDIDYVCGDARFLPFKDGSFDSVHSYSVFQHFSKESARTAFSEVARVLTDSGECLIQMPNSRGVRSFYNRFRRGFAEGKAFEVRYWTTSELQNAFHAHFRNVATTVHCYFGLGLELSDLALVSKPAQFLIRVSERLRKWSYRVKVLQRLADSLYVAASAKIKG